MTDQTPTEPEPTDEVVPPVPPAEPDAGDANATPEVDDAETFPRDYVLKLRDENAKYRQRAADRDEIAAKLHTALVRATGRLQDADDLPFDQTHLDDPDALTAALDALLTAKPHLATRKPMGSIGQGVSGASDTFSLAGALRSNAR
ncbi:MAG: hypothetical protein DI566_04240 [Microbacterium sp.]|nr:MAG: hypothetical protein DI566_04240 [Microbacterium sp.]